MRAVIKDESEAAETDAHRRVVARLVRLILNSLTCGLAATVLMALVILWLEKRSGMELNREQFRGLLLIIFLIFTLSTYVVLEFFEHRDAERDARAAAALNRRRAQRRKDETQPAFDPIFSDAASSHLTEDAEEAPPPPPTTADVTAGLFDTAAPPAPVGYANATQVNNDASAALFTQTVNAAAIGFDEAPNLFVQFCLHLFVIGGCGELTRRNALPGAQGKALLVAMLGDMGLSQRAALAFAVNANTFAQVPNFRGPIDAGYQAMAHLQDDGFLNIGDLIDMLAQWKIQESICQAPEPMTFMATSVGVVPPGTATTPEDRLRVLRAHNFCIGGVLERFQGREIHNLGNGIVAAFTDAGMAVRAVEAWQEHLDLFARENAGVSVAPRAGIDTEMAAAARRALVAHARQRRPGGGISPN